MIWLIAAGAVVLLVGWQVVSTLRNKRVRVLRFGEKRYIRFYPNFGFRLSPHRPEWNRHWGRR